MTALQALILGIVQGLGEFLPISSSGHLVLLQKIFSIDEGAISFDIFVHLGTLISLCIVMRERLLVYLREPLGHIPKMVVLGTIPTAIIALAFGRFFNSLFDTGASLGVGFIFTALLLYFAESHRKNKSEYISNVSAWGRGARDVQSYDGRPYDDRPYGDRPYDDHSNDGRPYEDRSNDGHLHDDRSYDGHPYDDRSYDGRTYDNRPRNGRSRYVHNRDGRTRSVHDETAMYGVNERRRQANIEKRVTPAGALIVGVAQGIAIIPAVSRSGSTIASGIMCDFGRPAAIEFAFLLSIPITLLAVAQDVLKMIMNRGAESAGAVDTAVAATAAAAGPLEMAIGFLAAAVAGYFTARFMLRAIQKIKLTWFSLYVGLLGILIVLDQLFFGLVFDKIF